TEVDHRSHRASDQPLDLDRASLLLPARRLSLDAVARRRRQERVLGCEPPAALVAEPAWNLFLHHRGAEDRGPALCDQRGSVGVLEIVRVDRQLPELFRTAAVAPSRHAAAPSWATVTCSTSPIGSR